MLVAAISKSNIDDDVIPGVYLYVKGDNGGGGGPFFKKLIKTPISFVF